MGVRCNHCKFIFPYAPHEAGRFVKCPFCDQPSIMPMSDPNIVPSLTAWRQSKASKVQVVEAAPSDDDSQMETPHFACPTCRTEVEPRRARQSHPVCPNCGDPLIEIDEADGKNRRKGHADIDPDISVTEYRRILAGQKAADRAAEAARARPVAEWMLTEFNRNGGFLGQRLAAIRIGTLFGGTFIYQNDNGNPAIAPGVLNEFRKLTATFAVWERDGYCWRRRKPDDDPTKRAIK